MRRIWAVAAGILMVFLCLPVRAAVQDRIVAVVNDDVITLFELNRTFEPFRARLSYLRGEDRAQAEANAREDFLNRMIDQRLIEQQTKKAGITVTEKEADGAIQDMMKRRNITLEELRKAVEEEGFTLEAYRRQAQEQISRMRLLQFVVKDKGVITDEEIGEYYTRNRQEYEGNVSVRVSQIFLPLPSYDDPEAKEKIKADMEAIHRRLGEGESFTALAAQHSKGPGAESGGDIGFIEQGMILTEIEDAVWDLPINQISEVVESPVGFHILQATDRRGAGVKQAELVRSEIKEKLEQEKQEKKFQEWMDTLREKAHIEIKL